MTISIVTPTFNAGTTIGEALQSVGSLDHVTEHLLVDAASTDNTLEVARNFPRVRILSEPDKGIYDGMNKGAGLACGDWLLFLQGDDWLPEGTLEAYRSAIKRHPEAEMFCGDCEAVRELKEGWSPVWSVTDPGLKKLTVRNIALGEPMINARLIRRDIFWKLGGFSLAYPLASDRDFLLRAAERGIHQVEIDTFTYRYRWHERSSTMTEGNAMTAQLSAENFAVVRSHLLDAEAVGDARKALLSWHSRITVQSAMNSMESLKAEFFSVCLDGIRHDPLWLGKFLFEFMRSIPGFVARGFKTRSQVMKRR